ncbi:18081_t:CDS:2 [Racocetra fulgida]|uniref:18081_t:CDS:1 n=1 Tax=Racocetra fulgida TaxID=60492 RepID=A0A9N9A4G9_9GLOM|nr:18081_t:CDS:2 [Racocetra fulgida]
MVNDLINSQSQIENMKKCCFCQASNIDNKKQICPNCQNKSSIINS